ncbi:MAG: IscS subfamily cysteine desulfurase [Deltaproteobacteria bacterium]|nr:IscS subfamily cysteine desulfurase [Deltaproteobacteria bacterium]
MKTLENGVRVPVYMDYHATTPVDPDVLKVMLPYFTEEFGNAASRSHAYGWAAEAAVEKARGEIAALVGADPKEIIFTSGATESDNIAVLGTAEMYGEKGKHIITTKIEHKAVLDPCKYLEKKGFEVTYLDVDSTGRISLEQLAGAIRKDTILVSVIFANNEIGTIQDIEAIGRLCKEKGVIFHTDAVQAIGKVRVDVQQMGIDLMSLSAHKMYGPKGVGALYVRRRNPRVRVAPVIHGGGHERGIRSGTLNVPGIVGFGASAAKAAQVWEEESGRLRKLRDRMWDGFRKELDEIYLNGHPVHRLPNNLNISFAFVEGESMMMAIKNVAVSSGSACTSASLEPSYVLRALGVGEELAHTSIRFGLGRFTTEAETDFVMDEVIRAVRRLRDLSPLYEMHKEGIDLKSVQWAAH